LSPAKHLPLASFEHHLLLSLLTFSLTIGWSSAAWQCTWPCLRWYS
jgi:hypothetical protein